MDGGHARWLTTGGIAGPLHVMEKTLTRLAGWLHGLTQPPPLMHGDDARLFPSFATLHLIGPLLGLPICAVLLVFDGHRDGVGLIFTIAVCLFWLFPLVARRTKRLEMPAFASAQLLGFVSLFGSYHYGGFNSPFVAWILVALLLSFLYVPRFLLACLGLLVAQVGVFSGAELFVPQEPSLGGDKLGALFVVSSLAAALYVSLIAAFYANLKTEGSALALVATRYRLSADKLRQSVAFAEDSNQRISAFMADVSHELRTPLNVVIGYSELLLEDAVIDERILHQRNLLQIITSSRKMLSLIDDVSQLSEEAELAELLAREKDEASGPAATQPLMTSASWQMRLRSYRQVRASARRMLLPALVLASAAGAFWRSHDWIVAALPLGVAIFFWQRGRAGSSRAPARDDLTGLLDRASFQQRLDALLASYPGSRVGLLFADLDGFKEVNDSLGHDAGDQLLATVAQRFAGTVPAGALLARLGGDEFGAAIVGDGADVAIRQIADAMLECLAKPIVTAEAHLSVGVSIGLSSGKAGPMTRKELLRRSDVAMYRAKQDKKSAVQAFDLQMDEALSFRRTIRQDLASALTSDQLDLHLQPVVDTRIGEIASAEALLRWTHPLLGAISPAKLIALAEESGQITSIDDWVLERALSYAARLQTVPIAINISPVQFRHPGFARKIVDRLAGHSVPTNLLRLEITEGVLVTHTRAAGRAIAELREAGIKVALDDFGTGFSSLSYLKDFRFDLLKIDRSFVVELDKGRQGSELFRAIVDLGHSLDMSVVAEGVETAAQAGAVQLLGCDYIQGYFTGRPTTFEAFATQAMRPPGTATARRLRPDTLATKVQSV